MVDKIDPVEFGLDEHDEKRLAIIEETERNRQVARTSGRPNHEASLDQLEAMALDVIDKSKKGE